MNSSNVVKCANCNVVINEVLAFMCNKLDIMHEESLSRKCISAFSDSDIVEAKNLLFGAITTNSKRNITRKKEGKKMAQLDLSTIFTPNALLYFSESFAGQRTMPNCTQNLGDTPASDPPAKTTMAQLDLSTILTPNALLYFYESYAGQRTMTNCTQNLGDTPASDPPAKKTNTEPLNRKRKYVPRKSLVVRDLEKRLKKQKLSDRANNILVKIEKPMKELNLIVNAMKRNNIETDTIKEIELKTQEIERNIKNIKEDAAKDRSSIDDEIKQWQLKEEEARIEAQKSIDEKQKLLDEAKKKSEQIVAAEKQREKDEIDRINIEIQNVKDAEDKELANITNNIQAKQNELAREQEKSDKYIKRKKEKAAVEKDRIEKKIRDIREKKKIEKRKIEREIKMSSETLSKEKDKSNRRFGKLKEEVKFFEQMEEYFQTTEHVQYGAENMSQILTSQGRYTGEEYNRDQIVQPRTSYEPRPSTSRDYIESIVLSDDETHTVNNTASVHPGYWSHPHNQWHTPHFWQSCSSSDQN